MDLWEDEGYTPSDSCHTLADKPLPSLPHAAFVHGLKLAAIARDLHDLGGFSFSLRLSRSLHFTVFTECLSLPPFSSLHFCAKPSVVLFLALFSARYSSLPRGCAHLPSQTYPLCTVVPNPAWSYIISFLALSSVCYS